MEKQGPITQAEQNARHNLLSKYTGETAYQMLIEQIVTGGRRYHLTRELDSEKAKVEPLHQVLANADAVGYLADVPTHEDSPLQVQIRTMLTGDRGYEGKRVSIADIATEDEIKLTRLRDRHVAQVRFRKLRYSNNRFYPKSLSEIKGELN